ncbi:HD domain-containing phosphohydrolase, partial [Acinetobacter baumannii]
FGRIAAVADVFDALTSERPYKKAWSPEDAMAYLKACSGQQFDPQCVNALASRWQAALDIYQSKSDSLALSPVPTRLRTPEIAEEAQLRA